ncbi:hypothetical protein BJX64DRAFT_24994 [Aspergillus heterothallicus]
MNTTATNFSLAASNPQTSTNLTSPSTTQLQTTQQPQSHTQAPHDATSQSQTTTSNPTLYPHQIAGAGGPSATAPFIRDFSLVAEAAKRAQMAIVTRDLEGISL